MENITLNGIEYTPIVKEENKKINQSFEFEVYPTDMGQMNWYEADVACRTLLGDGWRLPTRMELLLIYENKETNTFLQDDYYWSSTEGNDYYAWIQSFSAGNQYYDGKGCKCNVRAVKTIK